MGISNENKAIMKDNIAIAKMIVKEVIAEVGVPAPMGFAFLWGSVEGPGCYSKVLFGGSISLGNWDEVMNKIKEETDLISGMYINWD